MVDRLLRQLPHADPTLKGDPDPAAQRSGPAVATPRPGPAVVLAKAEPAWVTWSKVGLGVLLAVALTQWPYGRECGGELMLYLIAVGAVVLGGVWGAVASWGARRGAAHVVALSVLGYGLTLALLEILPRIGYATLEASWRCA